MPSRGEEAAAEAAEAVAVAEEQRRFWGRGIGGVGGRRRSGGSGRSGRGRPDEDEEGGG